MKSLFTILFVLIVSFSYAQDNWKQVSEYDGFARHHPITFSIDGTGYLLTGGTTFGLLADFWKYDPIEDEWTQMPDFPGGERGFAYGVAHNGKGYVGFGLFENANGASLSHSDLWEFDPLTEEWTELTRCACPGRFHPAFVALNGKLFVGLGASTSFGDLRDWWVYDIATDSWERKAELPAPARHHPYFFGIGDYVYAGMGHSGPSIFNDLWRYNLSTDTWDQMSDLPAQGRVAGTQFTYNDEGYVLAGQNEQHVNFPVGEFWKYSPNSDSWTELEAFPIGSRWAPGSFLIDNMLYFTSGEDNVGTFNNDMWSFDLGGAVNTDEPDALINELNVFPNPVQDILTLKAYNVSLDQAFVEVYDIKGALVMAKSLENQSLNVSKIGAGVYKIVIHTEAQTYVESFVKM